MRKYLAPALRYLFVYLFLPVAFYISLAAINVIYAALVEIAPSVPSYSQVLEKEKYEALVRAFRAAAALIAVLLISLLTGVYDNARYEDVITKTDGLYKIPRLLPSYIKSYLPADVFTVLFPAAIFIPLTLPAYSRKFLDYFGGYLAPHFALTEAFGAIASYFLILTAALLGRLLAAPLALRRYRALWLTSFYDG